MILKVSTQKLIAILASAVIISTGCTQQTDETTSDTGTNGTTGMTVETITETADPAAILCLEKSPTPNIPVGDVLSLAKQQRADSYTFALSKGADILNVDEGRSYAVWWQPENFNPEIDTVLVDMHGHGEFALKSFEVWYPTVEEREYAILVPEWWFGRSLENEGYYEIDQFYTIVKDILAVKGIPAKHVIFQGFSMGSARAYGVTLYDKTCGPGYFGVSIANSGQWEDGYPLYSKILNGAYGEKPFDNTHWILFCGEKDYNDFAEGSRTKDTCEGMENTQERLTQFGGIVDLFFSDPDGDHGSFNINKENETKGLDKAEEVIAAIQQEE